MNGINTDLPFVGAREFAVRARANVEAAHDTIIDARVAQTHYANKHRVAEANHAVGDQAYLSTKNLSVPKG